MVVVAESVYQTQFILDVVAKNEVHEFVLVPGAGLVLAVLATLLEVLVSSLMVIQS